MPPRPKKATTISPSVTQVAEAHPFITWLASGGPFHAVCCQRILPLERSTQKTIRSAPLLTADVRKMRSPQITGDDWPLPGSCDFQTMFSADQLTGRSVSVECPFCCGPRQRGQFVSPLAAWIANTQAATSAMEPTIRKRVMIDS